MKEVKGGNSETNLQNNAVPLKSMWVVVLRKEKSNM